MVSTHNKEMSEEVHSAKYLSSGVASMAVCAALNRAGGHDMLNMRAAWPTRLCALPSTGQSCLIYGPSCSSGHQM